MKQKLNLWRLQPAYIVSAGVYLVTLSMAYLLAGYAVLARRGA